MKKKPLLNMVKKDSLARLTALVPADMAAAGRRALPSDIKPTAQNLVRYAIQRLVESKGA
jgi:hypothetical protein